MNMSMKYINNLNCGRYIRKSKCPALLSSLYFIVILSAFLNCTGSSIYKDTFSSLGNIPWQPARSLLQMISGDGWYNNAEGNYKRMQSADMQ